MARMIPRHCFLLIPIFAGFAPCFKFELRREIVWRLEVELVSYFFDAHISSGE